MRAPMRSGLGPIASSNRRTGNHESFFASLKPLAKKPIVKFDGRETLLCEVL
jgi:hypothetical protein